MRIPIAATIFFVAAAAGLGWHNHQRLATLRAVRDKLSVQAQTSGMIFDSTDGGNYIRVTRRPREDRAAVAKAIAADLLAYARERTKLGNRRDPSYDIKKFNQVRTERVQRWLELDSKQLQIVIAEVLAAEDIGDDVRWDLLKTSIDRLGDDHPKEALAMIAGFSDRERTTRAKGRRAESLMRKPLETLAKSDPAAALEWFKNHWTAPADDNYTQMTIQSLVAGTAENDLRLALKVINESGGDPASLGARAFSRESRTPEERASDLAVLREWSAGITDATTRQRVTGECLAAMAFGRSGEPAGFESVTGLLDSPMLSQTERESVINNNLLDRVDLSESDRWVEWLDRTRPPDLAKKEINSLIDRWSRVDQVAVERWLGTVPNGPVKNSAVASYVLAITRSHPDAVVDRALDLLEGEYRIHVVKQICLRAPRNTTEERQALEAWAREQGVEIEVPPSERGASPFIFGSGD